jgi:double-stranded RNA-specific adenosine deaminase
MRHACHSTDFDLVDDVTLHFYTSSAPCGNATLKKFTKMERETYKDELGPNEWPEANHEAIPGHSLRLGQFALLIKKNTTSAAVEQVDKSHKLFSSDSPQPHPAQKGKVWPANQSDNWCPPGTSTVAFRKGSLHTCSDKLCRWNCLGLQGSLLASILKAPIYMSTITVGRKLTACICRRAICCRAERDAGKQQETASEGEVSKYSLHHPTVMGTGVFMDDVGKAKQSAKRDGTHLLDYLNVNVIICIQESLT